MTPLMSAVFELDHEELASDPRFAEIGAALDAFSPIDSEETFNRYCREACGVWENQFRDPVSETSHRFSELLERIERRSQSVIKTDWGGVVITLHEHPRVEKFLVIRKGRYLALEMHEEKDERMEVTEGAGLILWRRPDEQSLSVEVLKAGAEFHLKPGMQHCLIGTEDLLVFERSIDPKGMDQDLIFIYEPASA
jgi:mannose-6-phosphate isomerase-like protein (cupin superfamily)